VASTRVLSQAGGRVRLEVVGLKGDAQRAAEIGQRLGGLPGVKLASASWTTGNVLVEFDRDKVSLATIRQAITPQPSNANRKARPKRKELSDMQLVLQLS
jgi:hypothetical protein